MTSADTDTVADLQARIAFLDQEMADLRDSVDAHQQQILALERLCARLGERLSDALAALRDAGEAAAAGGDERPPHY